MHKEKHVIKLLFLNLCKEKKDTQQMHKEKHEIKAVFLKLVQLKENTENC